MAALPGAAAARRSWFASHRPHLVSHIHDPRRPGYRDRRMLSLLSEERLRRVLEHLLDENEFLSPFGIRSLSRYHLEHPYILDVDGQEYGSATCRPSRTPACSAATRTGAGPIWMPVNGLLIRALMQLLLLLRDRLPGRVPDRLGPPADALRGRGGDHRAAGAHLPARRARPAAASTAGARSSRTIRTGATTSSSTNTSTATTAPASAPATRPAGPASSPPCSTTSRPSRRAEALNLWSPRPRRRSPPPGHAERRSGTTSGDTETNRKERGFSGRVREHFRAATEASAGVPDGTRDDSVRTRTRCGPPRSSSASSCWCS